MESFPVRALVSKVIPRLRQTSNGKMRRRQSADSTDIELEVPVDPYMQAIMFPSEPRPEWHRHLRQVLHKAGQKIFKKPEHHDTHIPENLRYQLKQIYVY